jgi:adenylate cyclase
MTEQRRLAAILVADVVGYSRLVSQDESGTLARLSALSREVIEPVIVRHAGRLFKEVGDGFLVEFSSAVQAVTAALEIQKAAGPDSLPLRIGIHVGDVVVQGDDLMGDGVNIAARIEGIAEAGGIAISREVHAQVRDRLDIAFADKGEIELKNIARPVHVFAFAGTKVIAPALTLALPDKPSIAVLPFQNMSGDPEQEYFADGMVEDIITELSRFKSLLVIARNSTFSYKGKSPDIRQVGKELGVRYIVEGSVRKVGNHVRVTAQLIDAMTGNHLWAERYDRTLEDVFAVQDEVLRSIVAAVAPEVEQAETAQAQRDNVSRGASPLAWRAQGEFIEGARRGLAALMLQTIDTARQAIAADPLSLVAHMALGEAYYLCHLNRWGSNPEKALDEAWSVVERMLAIDALDYRTLTLCGVVRVGRGEQDRGIADLRRALEVNPNAAFTLLLLSWMEATAGLSEEAKAHALLAIRLSPRDVFIGIAHLALAMASFTAREYANAVHWTELAIQSQPRQPIRRAIMIACCARAGDLARATQESATLQGFAPDFIASLFRGENPVFTRREDMEHLLEGLRLAGLPE